MADTVTTQYIAKGPRSVVVKLTGISDATGETNVIKVALSGLQATGNWQVAPTRLSVGEIQWSIQGYTYIKLSFDHTTDDTAAVLAPGNGYRDYAEYGYSPDPASAGGTGDLLLSSVGAISGASYDIVVQLLLN